MATLLGVRIDSMPAKYLGLPYFVGRNKRELFSYVRTRVWQRVSGWKEKMLSQAGWRIMSNPNLLISRILKARYYRDNDFLHAKIGYNPSFTWRSILAARYIISKDLRVSDLLDSENGRWHKELIEGLFCPEDATLIQSIPLGQFNWADTIPLDGQCSTSSSNWQFIWSTKVPNKIKVFLWRLCREAIPTTSNLLRRRCVVEQACLTCGVDTETTKHVFLECSYARQVWALSNLPWKVINSWQDDVTIWLKQVRQSLDDAQFNWFANSAGVYGDDGMDWLWRTKGTTHFIASPMPVRYYPTSSTQWLSNPLFFPLGTFGSHLIENQSKLTSMRLFLTKERGLGLGVIARDWKGTCLAWRSMFIPNICSPEHGEALAARMAIEVRCHGRWTHCIIEGDCLQVVNKLDKKDDDLSLIGCIIADIRSLLPLHLHTSFCFTRRLANQAAHMLAKSAMGSAEGVIPPVFLSETIRADAPLNNI
ncbi:UNVERIFIED_CONTAM: hypothetical protein Sangu_2238800 [Sesamum angustifolium]|uniref:Reverse transcriptase zinc-binding domain-containing protein n=1 Tax=Sesamum angustifolium TaxID=2727405 RepID=A0AAW2L5S5_9LAMI